MIATQPGHIAPSQAHCPSGPRQRLVAIRATHHAGSTGSEVAIVVCSRSGVLRKVTFAAALTAIAADPQRAQALQLSDLLGPSAQESRGVPRPSACAQLDPKLAASLLGSVQQAVKALKLVPLRQYQLEVFRLRSREFPYYQAANKDRLPSLPDLTDGGGGLDNPAYFNFLSYIAWKVAATHLSSPGERERFRCSVGKCLLEALTPLPLLPGRAARPPRPPVSPLVPLWLQPPPIAAAGETTTAGMAWHSATSSSAPSLLQLPDGRLPQAARLWPAVAHPATVRFVGATAAAASTHLLATSATAAATAAAAATAQPAAASSPVQGPSPGQGPASAAQVVDALQRLLAVLEAGGYICGYQIIWGELPGSWPQDWMTQQQVIGLHGDGVLEAAKAGSATPAVAGGEEAAAGGAAGDYPGASRLQQEQHAADVPVTVAEAASVVAAAATEGVPAAAAAGEADAAASASAEPAAAAAAAEPASSSEPAAAAEPAAVAVAHPEPALVPEQTEVLASTAPGAAVSGPVSKSNPIAGEPAGSTPASTTPASTKTVGSTASFQLRLWLPADVEGSVALRAEEAGFCPCYVSAVVGRVLEELGYGEAQSDEFFYQDEWRGPRGLREKALLLLGDPLQQVEVPWTPTTVVQNWALAGGL